jgi:predicted CoA-substrate-specific enzyme activase
MSIRLGIDIGAVSVKAALVLPKEDAQLILQDDDAAGALGVLTTPLRDGRSVLLMRNRRTRGRPLDVTRELLEEITTHVSAERIAGLALTGSGSALVAEVLGAPTCNEFQASARAIDLLYHHVRSVFELGGETSRYIRLEPDPGSGALGILDYGTNGDCAAGTGAFLDQQASRLQFAVEEIGAIVEQAERAAQVAGRCSVFAKSDMIHAQQKGYGPAEVLRGLCNAVARNFKSAVVKGRAPQPPIALLGGVSANTAVVRALREVFELRQEDLFVPEAADALGAVGAAVIAGASEQRGAGGIVERLKRLQAASRGDGYVFPTAAPLSMERVTLLRREVTPYRFPEERDAVDAYLGLDIGSVGTKLVLIDDSGDVIYSIFTRTDGRPIEVVSRCLREAEEAVGWGVRVRAVGSTGSGRELIGVLVGADSINDEITAHKTGATFVADRLLGGKRPDTIFEIGGQDSKYISLQPEGGDSTDTVVVDFTMNDACAAGTGSFLEERAEELGVSIEDQFAELALSSKAPIRLGERCTVFMERDVNSYMQRGAKREDVIAGLAYSIAHNYINRVVRGRRIGDCIFFQGGTAYNDAVAAAFSMITGKEIIVPPHNVLMGAIGVALLAKEKIRTTGAGTRFRGYDLQQVDYTLREFTCQGCTNHCAIQEFTVQNEKTFWGDKCSERYRKQAKTDRKPVIPDLITLHHELLRADDEGDPPGAAKAVGIPLAMYGYDLLPLWRRFFRDCGFRAVTTSDTTRRTVNWGLDRIVAEPCFPIIVAHGHVAELVSQNVDFIWLPNILSGESDGCDDPNHVCPWGQTLPFVIRQAPAFRAWSGRILCPTIRLKDGTEALKRVLVELAGDLGVRRKFAVRAFEAALAAQERFRSAYEEAGREALETLVRTGEPGMVVVGRPYNIHDPGVSLSTAKKLRKHYGVNVLPVDALPVEGIDIADVNDNMYWAYGKRILAAAKLVGQHPNLHIIYITNFKCGPDSFVRGFIRPASNKPFLALQFDGHSNDAGTMTRCEAYLDSKGILRWWRTCQSKPEEQISKAAPSISPRCPTPLRG